MRLLSSLLGCVVATVQAFQPSVGRPSIVAMMSAKDPLPMPKPKWQVSTVNAWQRVINQQMGKRDFAMSRLQRIARKVNPLTTCVTDDECEVEIEESAAFFEEEAPVQEGA